MKRITMRELAKMLNVSVATVSKTMNDSHEISVLTKKRIREAANRLNYTLNPYAGSLRNKKSRTIGVVIPEIADNFFSLAIKGIQAVAEKKNYHVLIYLSHEKFLNEQSILAQCETGRVDGVLISVSSETTTSNHIQKLKQQDIPVVFFDREFEGLPLAKVVTNDFECGYKSAVHLIENGCRKPVMLSVSCNLAICRNRARGFITALQQHNMLHSDEAVIICNGSNEQIYKQVSHLLCGKNKPDGIVASVERLAMTVYLVSHQNGILIPRDLKVMVFSTLETAPILNPPLTTISQPAFEIGKTATELLFRAIQKKKSPLHNEMITLPSTLIERVSSQPFR